MKEFILSIFIGLQALLGFGGQEPNLGATILFPHQGGTGIGTATAGDVGKVLIVSDDSPFTYTLQTVSGTGDITGGASLGTGLNIFDSKSGATLRFNSISAGSNISLSTTSNSNTIVISSTASGGGDFPFTPQTWGVSTSTTIGLLNGFLSTASSTQSGNFFLPALSQGILYTGTNGLVNTAASSSIFGFTPISNQLTKGYFIVGDDSGVAQATSSIFISSTGNVGIGTTTPYAKFSITNTGTDPSFIVEDSASPDSSPFIIDATGNVGIGTAGPISKLHVNTTSSVGLQVNSGDAVWPQVFQAGSSGVIVDNNNKGLGSWVAMEIWGQGLTASPTKKAITFGYRSDGSSVNYGEIYGSSVPLRLGTSQGGSTLVLDTTGNVGIGTTDPSAKLTIKPTSNNASHLDIKQADNTTGLQFGTWDGGGSFIFMNGNTGTRDIQISTLGGSGTSYINSGNIGIGTTSPGTKLQVSGTHVSGTGLIQAKGIGSSGYISALTDSPSTQSSGYIVGSANNWYMYQDVNSSDLKFYFGGSGSGDRVTFKDDGNVGIGTTSPGNLLHVSGNSYDLARFESSGTSAGLSIKSSGHQYELQSDPSDSFIIYDRTNSAYRMVIQNSGNVGIGTTNPGRKLDVVGDVVVQGDDGWNGGGDIAPIFFGSNPAQGVGIGFLYGQGMAFDTYKAGSNGSLGGTDSLTAMFIQTTTGNVGIGTTTPNFKLVSTNSTGPQLSLSAGAGVNQWVMRNEGGELAFATSTYTATSSVSALRIDSNGWGIWQMLKSIAKLIIPFGANPTVNTQGEIAIDTTAASSSLAFYDGTAERRLYTDNTKSFFISTSTLSSFNGTGTTTIEMKMVYRPTTIVAVSCKATTTGTAYLDFGDGTNWSNLVTCNTTGTYTNLSSNNTFVMGEMMKFRLGTIATLTQGFTISYVERQDAD